MGRLFQYNRFGATDNVNKRKKDTQAKSNVLRHAIKCPDYSDIYGPYNKATTSFKKSQQWSHKLQFPSPTAAVVQDSSQSRTHKVFDGMRNFLHRKLFASTEQKDQILTKEEPTSDYDEQDLLDSSYHADDEEADCSCSSSTHTTPKRSPQKSLLSLNCWQSSQHSSDSSSSSSKEQEDEDSDAGISDCCQLLNDGTTPKRRSTPRKRAKPRYNINSDDDDEEEEPELINCPWYQPRISSKAAQEHLLASTPGSFLLRRSTPSSYELCLRLERKVKTFAIQNTRNQMYRLKGAKKQFTTVKALITHHSVMAEQLPLTLDMPRERNVVKSAAVRYADDFEPLESLQLLGILKSLQAKNYEM